ncbi:hypothetical protein MsAc7_09110 [Methanolapillus millepedarum]|uniref:Uncharacterized protein n=1 Tax=Methanolapillus millepedarum TaxID=3028296 RepID=A0AA96V455_9EURY|nr:hypothetical protein MsAc7_09110 [Methanosarcinaceae archaeon Ac7]
MSLAPNLGKLVPGVLFPFQKNGKRNQRKSEIFRRGLGAVEGNGKDRQQRMENRNLV